MQRNEISEIKQQAIIEKAQDPNSAITAEDAKKTIDDETRKAGGTVFNFDPNASAEEKARQIDLSVPPNMRRPENKSKQATALATDADTGPPQYDLPAPTKAGAIDLQKPNGNKSAEAIAAEDEDDKFWRIVGWKPRFGDGLEETDMTMNISDHSTWLEERLSDKFFGDWYFNAGVIIFACLTSWVIAVLGGGIGWVLLVMAVCSTYYRTSIRRTRRNVRDDMRRELAKARLETDVESLEWINSFLVKFWPIYAPVLCKTIVLSVDQVLSVATPPMVESLKMTKFTLGTKPPRLEHVKTYPKAEDDIVLMDWKFSFNPNDTADMTSRQLKVKQNPKVVLEVRIGKGLVSKGIDVIVEDMACEGLMRVKVKLQLEFPHIERVEICFLEKPKIDYVCKPLGGDTFGFDINFIPGLEGFILEQIHANLGPMMYAPNVFPIEIAKMLAGSPIDQACGVIQVTFHGAQGLKNPDQFAGTPDPYALIKINERKELARTKTVRENANPRWNETINVLVTSLKDTLNFHVYDWNEFRKDRELGQASFSLERFEEVEEFENEQLELTYNGRSRGLLQADVRYFPVLQPTKLADGTLQPPPETTTGIATFTIERCKDLDGTKSLIGLLNPYAVLLLNGKEVHVSEKLKRINSPVWANAHTELLITDRRTAKIGLVIKDDRDLTADPIIGSYQIKADDFLDLSAKGQEWYNLAGVKTGRVKMKLQWRPVDIRGSYGGGGYIKPIGVMRIYCKNARDLRNLETVGKSDPYIRALLSGVQKSRTVTWKNNLNPDFDEVLYVPVHSIREKLTLEIMDEETMGRDRSLGHLDISLKEFIERADTGEYLTNDSGELLSQTLQFGPGKSPKGVLKYTCSFFPTVPTIDPDEEEQERERSEQATANGRSSVDTPRPSLDSMKTAETNPRASNDALRKSIDKPAMRARTGTNASQLTNGTAAAQSTKESVVDIPKISITADNLIDYESGLLIFTIIDGDFDRPNCHLEVIMDDYVFASYSSHKIKSKKHEFNETGDAMVRELDQSRITLRLLEHIDKEGKGSEKHIVAKLSGPTLQTLQRCLYTPTPLVLRDDQGHESRVTVKLKFIPVKMKLDPSESFRNMGTLKIDLLDASNLPAADRNGYSDPYCKFFLGDKEIHKSDRKEKTLNPVWNETFDVAIRSRTAANLEVRVFDWDMGSSDDFLGKAQIDLKNIEPYMRKEITLPLDGKSGTVRMRLLFSPDWISRTRQGSSTFHGTVSTASKVAGAPVKGVTKVGGGVVKAGSFLGKSFRRRKSRAGSEFDPDEIPNGSSSPPPPVPSIEADNASTVSTPQHNRSTSAAASRLSFSGAGLSPNGAASGHGGAEIGYATVHLVSAEGFPASSNIRVTVKMEGGRGAKEVLKTKAVKAADGNVKFDAEAANRIPCTAETPFRISVVDHHTLGSDKELGEATFHLSDQGSGGEQIVRMLKGDGKLVVRSSFQHADQGSVASTNRLSKFGLAASSRRDGRERSATPGA